MIPNTIILVPANKSENLSSSRIQDLGAEYGHDSKKKIHCELAIHV